MLTGQTDRQTHTRVHTHTDVCTHTHTYDTMTHFRKAIRTSPKLSCTGQLWRGMLTILALGRWRLGANQEFKFEGSRGNLRSYLKKLKREDQGQEEKALLSPCVG